MGNRKRSGIFKRACLTTVLYLFGVWLSAQNQPLADSLENIYEQGDYSGRELLELLNTIAVNQANPDKALVYSNMLLEQATALKDNNFLYRGYLQKGNALTRKGDLTQALESYLAGLEIASELGNDADLGMISVAMAGAYSSMGNYDNAIAYYKRAISLLEGSSDSLTYASALENLGDEYRLNLSKPDSALIYLNRSGPIFEALDFKLGIAYNLGNKGLAYAQLGEDEVAEESIAEAIALLEESGDYYPIAVYLTYMSDVYASKGDWDSAFTYAIRSLELARQYGLKEQISDAYLKLSELYEKTGYASASLKYYKNYISFRDSVRNVSTVQEMANMRTNYEVARKQVEVDLLNQQKKTQRIIAIAIGIALFFIGLLAFVLYRRNRFIKATNRIIEQEMDKSDALLKNILPEATARELKLIGKVRAKKIDSVTVMFTDFKGFSKYSETLSPEDLVATVDFYFSKFDAIIKKYGLEKIKTIGDAYMCAGGLPYPLEAHAQKVVRAAFEIVQFVEDARETAGKGEVRFEVRVGIHTGTVVAGVVGTDKFAYDIWGDAVNIASRMETTSEPGKINISENTYQQIKETFECDYRGRIAVKNRGMMAMYFVTDFKKA